MTVEDYEVTFFYLCVQEGNEYKLVQLPVSKSLKQVCDEEANCLVGKVGLISRWLKRSVFWCKRLTSPWGRLKNWNK